MDPSHTNGKSEHMQGLNNQLHILACPSVLDMCCCVPSLIGLCPFPSPLPQVSSSVVSQLNPESVLFDFLESGGLRRPLVYS